MRTSCPPTSAQAILRETETQLAELSALVGDVVELARGGERDEPREDVRLDQLVEAVVQRMPATQRRHIETDLRPSTVHGMPPRSRARPPTCSTTRSSGARPAAS